MTKQLYPSKKNIEIAALESRFFKCPILLEKISSTNDYAKQNSDNLGTAIIVTKLQTSGRGRRGNKWFSNFGGALTFTLLFDFKDFNADFSAFRTSSILTAESIHSALMSFDDISKSTNRLKIKWPNDIMAGDKKICGILVEGLYEGDKPNKLIVGIGMNIGEIDREILKDKSLGKAGSIQSVYGFLPDVNEVFLRIVAKISEKFSNGVPDFEYINFFSYLNGQRVLYFRDKDSSNQSENAKVLFIDDKCRLVIEDDFGNVEKLLSVNSISTL